MIQQTSFIAGWSLRFVLCMLIGGCGGGGPVPTYQVKGTVTFPNGTPLPGGLVEFKAVSSEHNISARGHIQPDGTFEMETFTLADGAIEGDHLVAVMPPEPQGMRDRDAMGLTPPVIPEIIDRKFSRFETSGIKFTVTRDPAKNQLHIQVTRPGG